MVSDEVAYYLPAAHAAAAKLSDGSEPLWDLRAEYKSTYLPAQRADTPMPDTFGMPDADTCTVSGSFGEFWLSDSWTVPDNRV